MGRWRGGRKEGSGRVDSAYNIIFFSSQFGFFFMISAVLVSVCEDLMCGLFILFVLSLQILCRFEILVCSIYV